MLHKKINNIVVRNEVTMEKLYADNKADRLDLIAITEDTVNYTYNYDIWVLYTK